MNYKQERKRKYGEIILELREKNNMTQRELGEKLDINSNAISKWEKGMTLPNEDNILKLNKIFNVSIEDIYNNEFSTKEKNWKEVILDFIKSNFNLFLVLFIINIILLIILSLYLFNNIGKCNYYNLETTNQDYGINGSIITLPNRVNIAMSNLYLYDSQIKSSNYEISIYLENVLIYKIGNLEEPKENSIYLKDYLKNINVNLSDELLLLKNKKLNGKYLVVKIEYLDELNNIKSIELKYLIKKVFTNNLLFY